VQGNAGRVFDSAHPRPPAPWLEIEPSFTNPGRRPTWALCRVRVHGSPTCRQASEEVALIYVVFDQLLAIPWPQTLLGEHFPIFKVIPSV
jgi:hypothetical protein